MIFHRHLHRSYPFAVKGEACYALNRDGRRYLDGSSGAAVSCLGHSDAKVIEAMVDQLQAIPFAHNRLKRYRIALEDRRDKTIWRKR